MDREKLREIRNKSKYSIPFSAASIIYYKESDEKPTVSYAKYFAEDVFSVEKMIDSDEFTASPFDSGKVKVIYYGDADGAKNCLKSIYPKGSVTKTTMVAEKFLETRNLRSSSNDVTSHSYQEISADIRSLKRKHDHQAERLRIIESKLDEYLERIKNLEEAKDNTDEEQGYKTSHRITEKASLIIQKKRLNKKFRAKVNAWYHDDLTEEQVSAVKETLFSSTNVVSKITIRLGQIIFGPELLRRAILGVKGKFTRKPRKSERSEVIPIDKENILRVLSLFDDNLFTDSDGWNLLVRGPINQKGREITEENLKQRSESKACKEKRPRLDSNESDNSLNLMNNEENQSENDQRQLQTHEEIYDEGTQ